MNKFIAQKFGGTSLSTAERRQMVLGHIRREMEAGYQVALVVSAMGRRGAPYATDTLLDFFRDMGGILDPRNHDFFFVTAEMIAAGVMAHTLQLAGIPAVALTGGLAGIITEEFHNGAKVVDLDNRRLIKHLSQGEIPVVCGGQGRTQDAGDFSVLGRGGSDTSGVLIGIMICAERVDIYTDVEFVQAVDPLMMPNAARRPYLSYPTAYEMARFGAKVIHPGAVQLGMQHRLPIRVRSTFSEDPGTLIGETEDDWPLVGLPLWGPAQVAIVPGQCLDEARQLWLEQHLNVMSLVDGASGDFYLCAPAGDTSRVDRVLAEDGMAAVQWHPGYSLVSLVGAQDMLREIASRAAAILGRHAIQYRCQAVTPHRATFVVPGEKGRAALFALHDELKAYLEPRDKYAARAWQSSSRMGLSRGSGSCSLEA